VFFVCLFDVKLHEEDLKKIETRRSISELYVKLLFNNCAFAGIDY